jgi:hypothetical protein
MADGLVLPPIIMAMPDLRREIRLILVAESAAGAGLLELFNAVTEPLCQLSEVVHLPHIPRSPLGKVDVSVLQTYLADMGYPIAK